MAPTRVEAVALLRRDFELAKQAMMPVPMHPDHAPQQGQPMPQGQPAPQSAPVDPATGQPAADPAAGQPPAQPAVPPEMAAIMDKVISTVETQARAFEQKSVEQEQRISRLEQELANDKQMRDERRKVIESVMPAMTA